MLLVLWDNKYVRVRLDIPDRLHSKLVRRAHQEGNTANNLILRCVEVMLTEKPPQRLTLPIIESKRLGSLHLDNAKIFELIDFP